MKQIVIDIIIIELILSFVYGDGSHELNSTCLNSNFRLGNCIRISDCKQLNSLEYSINKLEDKCGTVENDEMICCPMEFKQDEHNLLPQPPNCGLINNGHAVPHYLSVGLQAKLIDSPWFAVLYLQNLDNDNETRPRCAGTLINLDFILTSASCFQAKKLKLKHVRFGDHNLSNNASDCNRGECNNPINMEINSSNVLMHPSYDHKTMKNDIALIKLPEKIKQSKFTVPICLPLLNSKPCLSLDTERSEDFNSNKYATGYGSRCSNFIEVYKEPLIVFGYNTTKNGVLSNEKLVDNVRAIDMNICKRIYSNYNYLIDARQICINLLYDSNNQKFINRGGPLTSGMYNGPEIMATEYLIGITSFRIQEYDDNPFVFTNVLAYMDWILESIK